MKHVMITFGCLLSAIWCAAANGVDTTKVDDLTMELRRLELAVGDSYQMQATVLPAGYDHLLYWGSSHPDVARIDTRTGLLIACRPGNAVITATAEEHERECALTVRQGDFTPSVGKIELDADDTGRFGEPGLSMELADKKLHITGDYTAGTCNGAVLSYEIYKDHIFLRVDVNYADTCEGAFCLQPLDIELEGCVADEYTVMFDGYGACTKAEADAEAEPARRLTVNRVKAVPTGLDAVGLDALSVRVDAGVVSVEGLAGAASLSVYAADGRLIAAYPVVGGAVSTGVFAQGVYLLQAHASDGRVLLAHKVQVAR